MPMARVDHLSKATGAGRDVVHLSRSEGLVGDEDVLCIEMLNLPNNLGS